jgi:hypothetical protein
LPFRADVPHEAVDLGCCQLTLARWEPAQVLRCNLTQALRVRFLYDSTSARTASQPASG